MPLWRTMSRLLIGQYGPVPFVSAQPPDSNQAARHTDCQPPFHASEKLVQHQVKLDLAAIDIEDAISPE